MSLFDKILNKKKEETAIVNNDRQGGLFSQDSIDDALDEREKAILLSDCIKIPLTDISMLGSSFAQLLPAFRTASQTITTVSDKGLFRCLFPSGVTGTLVKDRNGLNLGTILPTEGGLRQARWVSAESTTVTTTNMVMPIDPTTLLMAAALASIDKKLTSIMETQKSILSFMDQDKQAGQKGDLDCLTAIVNSYKYNWDNKLFKENNHQKVLSITRTARQNIYFYQDQIANEIRAFPGIHFDKNVNDALNKMEKHFHQYRLALHIFSFASFLDVMLLGNFREEYLEQVAGEVEEKSEQYSSQLEKCRALLKEQSASSIETQVLNALGNAEMTIGKGIDSIPKFFKGPLLDLGGDLLQSTGENTLKNNKKKVSQMALSFSAEADTSSVVFVESIKKVAEISNHTSEVLYDGENLFLATE